MFVPCKNIPTYTYETNTWSTTSFENQKEFGDFLFNTCFKEPGEYLLDESTKDFDKEGRTFTENGRYTEYSFGTTEYNNYWDTEKLKCRLGVIWKHKEKTWYLTRDYYFLLNFCPILNKEKGSTETFMSIRDVQLHMMLYEKIAECYHLHSCVLKRRQMAYEQPHSSLILAKDGWTTMGNLSVGDEIRNPDGTTCFVTMKSDNGLKDIYNLVLDDGTQVKCGPGHLWKVYKNSSKKPLVLTTKQIIDDGLYSEYSYKGGLRKEYKYRIENIQAIQYEKNLLPIDPYVLGVLIGDGSISNKQVSFTTYDEDIADRVFKNLGEDYSEGYCAYKDGVKIKFSIKSNNRFDHDKNNKYENTKHGCNPLIRELEFLGLMGKNSHTKFIPEIYKYSSIEDRLSLLQGLMDTDGYINAKGRDIHYTTVSKQLANDIYILTKELGLTSNVYTLNNEYGNFYRVRISGEIEFELFSTFRKVKRQKIRNSKNKRSSFKDKRRVVDIISLGYKEQCSCIMVDNPNHLYITDGYTVTHNSNCHVAKSLNFIWFENKKTIKWFASSDYYLNAVDGSWKMLDAIRNHLNANTDWIRIFTPSEYPKIQQKEKFLVKKGQWGTKGNESTLSAKPLVHDPTSGVGGAAFWIWHEEGGVAPKANTTLQYLNPALESGLTKVGSFHIGGSVGDLTDCEPLKNFILKPDTYEMFKVPCKWVDETNVIKEYGLFIPAQYGMPEAVDEFGNSLVDKALKLLEASEEQWKLLPPADYVLKRSQNPKSVKEAFAWRNVSFFNVQRIERRQKTIELLKEQGDWEEKQGLLEVDNKGEIILKPLTSFPEVNRPVPMGYPVKAEQIDKRGCVTIWEEPDENLEPGVYFAGVDSVEVGYTDTSESLTTVHIYKRGCKIIKLKPDGSKEVSYERGKIVATYAGRFNNPKDHNEQGLLLLRKYKALAACERNRPNFINYCRDKGYSHLIARRSEMPFNKDLDATGWKNDEYGVYSGNDKELLKKIKQALYEHVDSEIETFHKATKDDTIGEVIKTIRGYDITKDYWLLEELKLYNDDSGNFDRVISAGLAIILGVSRELDHEKTIYEEDKEYKRKQPTLIKKHNSLLPSSNKRYKNLLKR